MNTDTRLIPLTQGKFAIVDACDYEFLMQWKWCAMKSKCKKEYWRAVRNAPRPERRNIYMHWDVVNRSGLPSSMEYDHKDGNPLNNTRGNLRPATRSLNNANKPKPTGTSSKYKGAHWDKHRNKWLAKIKVNGVTHNLGRFDDEQDAADAYAAAALRHFGEFARLD